jgi:ATP/maltotriose-dependent transcriptional regulator MalT
LTAEALSLLGKVHFVQGNYTAARALYEESMAFSGMVYAGTLEKLADVVAAQGEPMWAAQLWGAAETLRENVGIPILPDMRSDYERSVAAARAQLGKKGFVAAWEEGRAMTPEQALAARGKAMISHWPTSATPRKLPTTSPDGLSARELEVLRLIAQGLTDAQIAEHLVLSLHTIHAHLRTIYSKLGVTSRSAATRYAFEHQLV